MKVRSDLEWKNVKVSIETWKKLRSLAASQARTMQEFSDEILLMGLKTYASLYGTQTIILQGEDDG